MMSAFKPLAAALAVFEELAGVGRHRFGRLISAFRPLPTALFNFVTGRTGAF
jgi:hypothetical protein